MFKFIIGLVTSPSYIPSIIQEGINMNVVDMNEHLIHSLICDAEDLFFWEKELYGL